MFYSRPGRLAFGKFLLKRKNLQQTQLKESWLESETPSKVPHAYAVICGIYYWGQNMTFLEASQLGGIWATAYPADCSGCHTPLAFSKTPLLSPCRSATLQLLCAEEPGGGNAQCNPYIRAPGYVFWTNCKLHCTNIKAQGKRYPQSKHNRYTVTGGRLTPQFTTDKFFPTIWMSYQHTSVPKVHPTPAKRNPSQRFCDVHSKPNPQRRHW